jgi:hypothetical protein
MLRACFKVGSANRDHLFAVSPYIIVCFFVSDILWWFFLGNVESFNNCLSKIIEDRGFSQGHRRLQGTVRVTLNAREKKWDTVKSLSVSTQHFFSQ